MLQMLDLDLCLADAQADAVPEPEGEDFKKAVSVLLPYLLSHRTRLASSLEYSSSGAEDSASAARQGGSLSPQSCNVLSATFQSPWRGVPEGTCTVVVT